MLGAGDHLPSGPNLWENLEAFCGFLCNMGKVYQSTFTGCQWLRKGGDKALWTYQAGSAQGRVLPKGLDMIAMRKCNTLDDNSWNKWYIFKTLQWILTNKIGYDLISAEAVTRQDSIGSSRVSRKCEASPRLFIWLRGKRNLIQTITGRGIPHLDSHGLSFGIHFLKIDRS